MKKIIHLFLPIALFSCENSENKMFLENKGSNFKNYTYQPKEVINGENKELNYKTETKCIGTTQIDSFEYKVFTEFRKIQLANSIRGRSTLFFINESLNDTLAYDMNIPDNLPIDIYNNHFVFKRGEDSTYVFSKLELEVKDVISFDGIECFMSL